MIGTFVVVCLGMVLGMLLVRVWDEASRAVAELPPEGARVAARQVTPTAAPAVSGESASSSGGPGDGAITTEIRVLQPNYTVAPGDTLASIARRHGTSIEALASMNNLENRNSLSVGQKLIIP
jgi:LysM repeat protein